MIEAPVQRLKSATRSPVSSPPVELDGPQDEEWRIGDWTFRPLLHRLRRDGEHVRLEPKVSDLLLFLVRRARQPVSKDSIFEGVWEQKFLGDSALTRTMAELRRALGDDARQPTYIETIPKVGYRLIADVRCLPAPRSAMPRASFDPSPGDLGPDAASRDRLGRFVPWIVVALLMVALASLYAVPTFRPTIGASPEALTEAETPDEPKLVAVLPLADLAHLAANDEAPSAASENAFAAGMTEALEARLAQSGTVSVMSRHSVQRLLAEDLLLDRARGVGVDALVEGTVQRVAQRVRITVRLTELNSPAADRDTYSWVETYERDLRDVLALQEEISRAIADEVHKTLVPTPAVLSADEQEAIDPEAYEVYLQARYVFNQRSGGWRKKAVELFDRAVEMSPGYAPAHAGRARVYSQAAEHGSSVAGLWEGDLWDEALASARTALALDPESTEAHGVTAMAAMLYRWDWRAAERHLRQALASNPSDAWVRQRFAYFLTFHGRFDEAIVQVEKALKLDPLSPVSYSAAAHVYFHAGRYDRVYEIEETVEARLGHSNRHSGGYGAWALAMEGRYDEALERLAPKAKNGSRWRGPTGMAIYGWTLAKAGRLDEAEAVRQEMLNLSYEDPFARAILETGVGDHDEAFAALGRALDERSHSIPYLKVEPFLRSLQDDPRFEPMVARLGL